MNALQPWIVDIHVNHRATELRREVDSARSTSSSAGGDLVSRFSRALRSLSSGSPARART